MSSSAAAKPFPFAFVTGNAGKRREAERLLGGTLESLELDLPEIQSADLFTVLRAKGEEAFRRLGRPIVVEETGFEIEALNGFPGPLVKWMLEAVGAEGLARTALALDNPRARACCALLVRDPLGSVEAFGYTEGRLVLPARGDQGFGWDPVFEPDGEDKTYGELSSEEKDRLGHRGRAWRALLDVLRRERRLEAPPGSRGS